MYFCYKTNTIPRISYMNQTTTGPDWMHSPRVLQDYVLIIVTKGELFIEENKDRYHLKAGDYLLLQPSLMHEGYQEAACEYYYIHISADTFTSFDCSQFGDVVKVISDNKRLFYKCDPFSDELYEQSRVFISKDMYIDDINLLHSIELCMTEAIRAFESKDEHYKLICSCKFMEILAGLSSYFSSKVVLYEGNSQGERNSDHKTQELILLIQKEYATKITGSFIEEKLGMNFDYLNRMFKKQMGSTIFQYLNQIRIQKAKELLLNGNLKSYEIATMIGFCDEYHFSKVFKKTVGISPKNYFQDDRES